MAMLREVWPFPSPCIHDVSDYLAFSVPSLNAIYLDPVRLNVVQWFRIDGFKKLGKLDLATLLQ